MLYYELLQKGQTVTSDVYCRQLTKVAEKYHSFYGRTTKRCSPILLHDSARPHTSNQTKKCFSELNFEVFPHPPYSPDMAPTDFHLFRSLQHFLSEKIFNDIEEVKICLSGFFASKHLDFYYNGMHKLKQRWRKISSSNGLYITD